MMSGVMVTSDQPGACTGCCAVSAATLFNDPTPRSASSHVRLIMPIGKHRGSYIDELPSEYVNWMLLNAFDADGKDTLPFGLRRALEQTLRDGTGQTAALRRLVDRWWEELDDAYGPGTDTQPEVWESLLQARVLLLRMAGLDRKALRAACSKCPGRRTCGASMAR